MLFARPPAMRPAAVDLAQVADTVIGELAEQAREQSTHLVRTGQAGPLIANADPTQIAVALKALIQNALEALKAGGSIVVDCKLQIANCKLEEGQSADASTTSYLKSEISYLQLTVTDTGPGIPQEIRPHIFDPYYCGREAGRGLGLGLSKAWRIAELHGGRIEVESEPGRGAKFTIFLPSGEAR
jgi:signal transduction histidine kinase